MNGWLLDDGVLFELRNPRPNPEVKSWSDAQNRKSLFLSVATISAIRHFSERRCDAALHTELGIWIDQVLRPWFGKRILPVTEDIVMEWHRTLQQRSPTQVTTTRDHPDLLLIATARVHRLTICTRDDHAYAGVGAPAFNPWNASCP